MVYTRIGYGGFDNGTLVSKPYYSVKVEPGLVYSFKVTAVNWEEKVFLLKSFRLIRQNVNERES